MGSIPSAVAVTAILDLEPASRAIDLINTQLLSLIGDKVIKVSVGDNSFELKYSDVNPTVSADETVEEALEYGKDAKLFKKKKMIEKKRY